MTIFFNTDSALVGASKFISKSVSKNTYFFKKKTTLFPLLPLSKYCGKIVKEINLRQGQDFRLSEMARGFDLAFSLGLILGKLYFEMKEVNFTKDIQADDLYLFLKWSVIIHLFKDSHGKTLW